MRCPSGRERLGAHVERDPGEIGRRTSRQRAALRSQHMSTLTTAGPAIPSMNGTRRHRVIDSPLGELTLVAEAGALAGVYFAHHRGRPGPAALGSRDDTILDEATTQLGEYFAGTRTRFDLAV